MPKISLADGRPSGREAQVEMWRSLVHVYHSGEDVAPPDLPFHKSHDLGDIGLYIALDSAREKFRVCCDKHINEHGIGDAKT